MMIKVAVMGALGRMGSEVCKAVSEDPELELVGAVDPAAGEARTPPGQKRAGIEVLTDKTGLNSGAVDVMVDFTKADVAVENIFWALESGIHSVVGTTGIPEDEVARIKTSAETGKANVIIAANFALGAVLMMKFSESAAKVFDQCEIIEMHHRGKLDAPSGTAITTAKRIMSTREAKQVPPAEEREIKGSRGGQFGDVKIHSARLDGLVAHQEVIFGSRGETLRLRHDTIDRSCFMPGVLIAVKAVGATAGLTIGLEPLLGA
jgi:4-hydroxy-tetrahydrodipicolinate reductase